MPEKVTAVKFLVELTAMDDRGEIAAGGRRLAQMQALEAEIPPEVRAWLLGRVPVKES